MRLKATIVRDWQQLSPAAKLLILNGLAFNTGFYMLMPFLANHLGGTLGLAGWASGLIIGMRVFSQQGLFLVGGMLGDRIGYRPAIILGCLVRSMGFSLLGWANNLPLLLLAACLTGFAGALFTPCAQAYLAAECKDNGQRQAAFSLHNLASTAGMLLGPLIGLALLSTSFMLTGLVAGVVFFLLTWAQWKILPADSVVEKKAQPSIRAQWSTLISNRPFLIFCSFATAYQLLFHQLYLAVPAFIYGNHLDKSWLSVLFTINALIGVLLQLPASALVNKRLGTPVGMGIGLAMMGASYLPFILFPSFPIAAIISQIVLFSVGSILCYPLFSAFLPKYASQTALGAYYGFYSSFGGCIALLSNLLVGALLGSHFLAPPVFVWLLLSAWGILAGFGLYRHTKAHATLA